MVGRESDGKYEAASEVVVSSELAEELLAHGRLKLSPKQIEQLSASPTIRLPVETMELLRQPKVRQSPIEWMTPIEAVHHLAPHLGGDAAAKSAIVERLRDQAIACPMTWMSMGPDIGPLDGRRPKFPVLGLGEENGPWVTAINPGHKPLMMGGVFWDFSENIEEDAKRWNWRSGIFVSSREDKIIFSEDSIPIRMLNLRSRHRFVVSGVRFSREDILKIIDSGVSISSSLNPINSGEKEKKSGRRGKTGPRLKGAMWVRVLTELEREILACGVEKFGNPRVAGTQSQVETYVQRRFAEISDKIPSESTIRRRIQGVMKDWRATFSDGHDPD